MARLKSTEQLTPLELELMKVLWETGPATVQTVLDQLPGEPKLAYTTVQTMLNVLHRKGKVEREKRERAFVYAPVVSRARALQQATHDLIQRVFGGSAERLVLNLIETQQLSPETLKRLNRMVEDGDGRD